MSIRLTKEFRLAAAALRDQLAGRERDFFDYLCAAGELGYRLPNDLINLRAAARLDPRRRLAAEFSNFPRGTVAGWRRVADRLAPKLLRRLRVAELDEADRPLRILLAYVTIALAPDLVLPREPIARAVWDLSVKIFPKIFAASIAPLGPVRSVASRLPALRREIQAGLRIGRVASGQRPGPAGCALAVDAALIRRVSRALGKKMEPGYMARYLFYAKAGDHIWPHPDDPKYDVTLLICVAHEVPPGAPGSAFLAYRPRGSIKRYPIPPGHALALEPGLVHAREPVQKGERVALLSIGLCRVGKNGAR